MPFDIAILTLQDIPSAMRLVEHANWNQTPLDWLRILGNGAGGCFKAVDGTSLVGTVTTTRYGFELAWIGMMLVDPNYRRQGIGRALMQRALAHLNQQDTATVALDATPSGRPLYESLSFRAQWDFQRWQRRDTGRHTVACDKRPITAIDPPVQEHLFRLRDLDRRAFGVDRISWLARVAQDSQVVFHDHGYGMVRPGRIAPYLGPVVASDMTVARTLVTELAHSTSGPLIWDIFPHNHLHAELARELGFEPVRTLTRMLLGDEFSVPEIELQIALCDPASG